MDQLLHVTGDASPAEDESEDIESELYCSTREAGFAYAGIGALGDADPSLA